MDKKAVKIAHNRIDSTLTNAPSNGEQKIVLYGTFHVYENQTEPTTRSSVMF